MGRHQGNSSVKRTGGRQPRKQRRLPPYRFNGILPAVGPSLNQTIKRAFVSATSDEVLLYGAAPCTAVGGLTPANCTLCNEFGTLIEINDVAISDDALQFKDGAPSSGERVPCSASWNGTGTAPTFGSAAAMAPGVYGALNIQLVEWAGTPYLSPLIVHLKGLAANTPINPNLFQTTDGDSHEKVFDAYRWIDQYTLELSILKNGGSGTDDHLTYQTPGQPFDPVLPGEVLSQQGMLALVPNDWPIS